MGPSLQRIRAVIEGELRSLARQKTPFVLRTAYAALAAAVILQAGSSHVAGTGGQALSMLAFEAFRAVAWIQITLAALAGAVLGVTSAYLERHNRTLGLLVLSQLTAPEVMLGKLLALLGLVASILIGALPVFAIIGWAGGLDYRWLGALGVLTVALAAQGIATGLACGFRWRSGTGAAAAAVAILGVLLFAAPRVAGDWCLATPFRLLGLTGLAASEVASQGQTRQHSGQVLPGTILALAWTAAMVHFGSRQLPRAAAGGAGRGLRGAFEKLDLFFEEIDVFGIRIGSGQSRPARGNPVAWLGHTSAGLGLPRYGIRLLTAALLLSCWSFVLILDGGRWAGPVTLFWAVAVTVVGLAVGAATFGGEKERGNLALLLATPMPARTMLTGKLHLALRLLLLFGLPAVLLLSLWGAVDRWLPWEWRPFIVYFLAGPVCGYLIARHLSLVLASSLRAGFAAALTLGGLLILFATARHPFWPSPAGLAAAAAVMAASVTAGWWAHGRRRPGLALVAFLVALAAAVAAGSSVARWDLVEWHPLLPLSAAVAIDVYTRRSFDLALGRSP